MKIHKPDNLALLFRHFRLGREKRLALGMLAMFPFGGSGIAALHSEQALWRAVGQVLGDGVLDEGLPKPAGEFFVYGAAYAPGGGQVRQIEVVASIAGLRKSLYVFGDRHFGLLNPSEAAPFSRMPLGAEQAFGGEGYAPNPLGKGHVDIGRADGQVQRPLPNVESPRQLMVSRGDQPLPAGYAALPPGAPERLRQLGSFDQQWLQQRWPFLPDDTRAEFFHAAPVDQRLKAYFRGDEGFELVNLHPEKARIAACLPGLRARCFVQQRTADGERFTELEARADSVWLFPDLECGVLLYRATARVADDDGDDVLHVMAQWEELAAAPADIDHYRALLGSLTPAAAAAVAAEAALATPFAPEPGGLAPAMPVAGMAAASSAVAVAGGITLSPQFREVQEMVAEIEQQSRAMMRQYGLSEADVERQLTPQVDAPMTRAQLEVEVARLEGQTQQMRQQYGISDEDVARYSGGAGTDVAEQGGGLDALRQTMLALEQQVERMLAENGMTHEQALETLAARPETAMLAAQMKDVGPGVGTLFSQLEAAAAAAAATATATAAAAATTVAIAPAPVQPAVSAPKLTREQVVARHASGASLRELDLSDLDLSALDLMQADFSGSLLAGTRFSGSKLDGGIFHQALLTGADFSQASLRAASLNQASAATAVFSGASLAGADLSLADFTGGNFEGAILEQAQLEGSLFDQAAMSGVRAAGCQAAQASFAGADLAQADFSQARMARARFNGAALAHARFEQASCVQAEFYGTQASAASFAGADLHASRADASSTFEAASFVGARMAGVAWEGASIRRADLQAALLEHADLSRVVADGASLVLAQAAGAKLDKASLRDADLSRINLRGGSLRAAMVEGASLQLANLHGVDFHETAPARAALEGANIDRTVLALRGVLT